MTLTRLSWNQRHRLLQSARDADVGLYNPHHCILAVSTTGEVDFDRLNEAWTTLQMRHPVLRTVVDESEGLMQEGETAPVALQTAVRQASEQTDQLVDFLAAPLGLNGQNFTRLIALREGAETQIGLAVDHLICDGWSLTMLQNELQALYQEPRLKLEAKSARVTFSDFVARQYRFLDSAQGRQLMSQARKRVARAGAVPAMPLHGLSSTSSPRHNRSAVLRRSVGVELYRSLAVTGRRVGLSPLALAHAALHRVLAYMSDRDYAATTLSTANRAEPSDRSVVGWIASKTVVVSEPKRHVDIPLYLRHFKKAFMDALDDSDIPWPALIHDTSRKDFGRHAHEPYVTFNARPSTMTNQVSLLAPSAGMFTGQQWQVLDIDVGWQDSAISTNWYETDRSLEVVLSYKTDWYQESIISDLWGRLEDELHRWQTDLHNV